MDTTKMTPGDKNMDMIPELKTTTMEDVVKPPVFEFNTSIPLSYSNNSNTGTITLALDMILILKT